MAVNGNETVTDATLGTPDDSLEALRGMVKTGVQSEPQDPEGTFTCTVSGIDSSPTSQGSQGLYVTFKIVESADGDHIGETLQERFFFAPDEEWTPSRRRLCALASALSKSPVESVPDALSVVLESSGEVIEFTTKRRVSAKGTSYTTFRY